VLLDFRSLYAKYNLDISGVLHVGAHTGEEAEIYDSLGIREVTWVEPNPDLIPQVHTNVDRFGHNVIEALVTDKDGFAVEFNITNVNGMSSSVLEFGTHPEFSPEIHFEKKVVLESRTIDSLAIEYGFGFYNMLSMDIQGAELMALKGAKDFLNGIDVLMCEVNKKDVYIGCAKVWEIDGLLEDYGFWRVETYWVADQGWGDALFIKQP
jgi:FkbM family methyltransferase